MIATVSPFVLTFALLLAAPADNAADDYLAASKLYQEPDYTLSETLEKWAEGEPAPAGLAAVLSDNVPALESLAAGTRKPRCDFPPNTSVPGMGPDVPSIPLLKLGKLLVLRGRALLDRGEVDGALADYLSAFKLVGHLGRMDSLISRVVGATLEHYLVAMTEPSVRGGKMKRPACSAIKGYLEAHLRQRPSAVDLVEIERRQALAIGKTIAMGFAKKPEIAAACTREFGMRVDAYFDPFSRYAKSHMPDDKTGIEQAARRLSAEVKAKRQQFEAVANKIAQGAGQDQKKLMEEVANSGLIKAEDIPTAIAALTMGSVAVDLTSPIDTHFQGTAALEKLRTSMAACR